MTDHKTGTREEWLAARLELLEAEKELTRRSDELARRRQELPWVRIDKEYRFETDEGSASLADLFRGRSQLLVYHFMFGPDYTGVRPARDRDGFAPWPTTTSCFGGVAGAAREAAGVQAADGVDVPWASARQRLQLRLTLVTEEQQREGRVNTTSGQRWTRRGPSRSGQTEPTWPRTRARGRA